MADNTVAFTAIEQAIIDGVLKFAEDHPELIQKVITLAFAALAMRLEAWLAELAAANQKTAGPTPAA